MTNFFANGRLRSFALLFSDMAALALAIWIGFYSCKLGGEKYDMLAMLHTWPIFLMLISMNVSGRLYCGNLFYPGLTINPVEELRRLTLSCAGSFLIFLAFLSLSDNYVNFSRIALIISMAISLFFLPIGRIILRYLLWRFNLAKIPAMIAGDTALAKDVAEKMVQDNYCILSLKASCCSEPISDDIVNDPAGEFLKFAHEHKISYLIYCVGDKEFDRTLDKYMPHFLNILVVNSISRFPILWSYPVSFYRFFSFEISNRMLRRSVLLQKRLLEIILTLVGMSLLLIPGIVLACLVKLSSRGPVFYRAKRLGRYGKPIEVLKFRTMCENADKKLEQLLQEDSALRLEWENSFKLENDPRITPVGRFLRRTSLDELPQFWNVLKGEMALIGPRPIVDEEVPLYGEDYETFASVKPGITGLWQVSGRSDVCYADRVALDVFYVKNWSIWMDYYIFFATINAVILRRGAK